jgi:hypothetical protein
VRAPHLNVCSITHPPTVHGLDHPEFVCSPETCQPPWMACRLCQARATTMSSSTLSLSQSRIGGFKRMRLACTPLTGHPLRSQGRVLARVSTLAVLMTCTSLTGRRPVATGCLEENCCGGMTQYADTCHTPLLTSGILCWAAWQQCL